MQSKYEVIDEIIKESFEQIIEELKYNEGEGRASYKTKTITMIETTPLTNIRMYMFDILETICSLLIQIGDTCGPIINTILS